MENFKSAVDFCLGYISHFNMRFSTSSNFPLFWGSKLQCQLPDVIPAGPVTRLWSGLAARGRGNPGVLWARWVGFRWDGSQGIQLFPLLLGMKVPARRLLFGAYCAPGPLKSSLHISVCWTLNEGIAAFFTEKCHIHVGSRLWVSVTVCQQGSKQMFRALSLPNQKVKGGLQPINTNSSAAFFSTYLMLCFFAAEHWLHQPIQQLCSRPAPVLAWRWALLVTGEGGLLPCISGHERMWGKLPGAERADRVSHRRLWGLDKNYYCYPQVACSQVLYIVNQWCQWYLGISCLFFDATLGKSYKLWIKAVLKIGRAGKNILCSPKWEKLSILKVPEWSIKLNYKATRNPEHFNLTSVSSSWCCLSLRISVRSEAPAREW